MYTIMQWKSHASILVNETIDEKVSSVQDTGLTVLSSHDQPNEQKMSMTISTFCLPILLQAL